MVYQVSSEVERKELRYSVLLLHFFWGSWNVTTGQEAGERVL